MFNFIAYPIFKKRKEKKNTTQHHDTDSKHPVKNYQGQNSLSLSHLKEHNCLSLIQLWQKKEKKKKKLQEF